jgi:uncharacterized protein YnzC (UPF0291/DUF896 family)
MADKKNRRDYFEEIKAIVAEDQDLVAFVDGEIAKIDNRAAKEKEKRAEKRAQGDELQAAVKAFIQDHEGAVTAQVIADEIGGEDVTKAKVTYRATQLVKAGEIFKVTVKTEDGRKAVAYTAEAPAEDVDAE